MSVEVIISYVVVLLILVCLEGLLAADNAIVLALMVGHLPEKQRKRALFYGLLGAVVFRFGSLFVISYLVDIWQIQALGAAYLLIMSVRSLYVWFISKNEIEKDRVEDSNETVEEVSPKEFWWTVAKVEFADLAFAIDSILAAVALAVTLPETGLGQIGNMDAGHFVVIFLGGLIGVIIMRFAANYFVSVLQKRPNLEVAAYIIVGWVGVKLTVMVLAHSAIGLLPKEYPHSTVWQIIFYGVLLLVAIVGWFSSKPKELTKKRSES